MTATLQYDPTLTDLESADPDFGYYRAEPPGDNFIAGTDGTSGFFETIDFSTSQNDLPR